MKYESDDHSILHGMVRQDNAYIRFLCLILANPFNVLPYLQVKPTRKHDVHRYALIQHSCMSLE